MPIPIPISFKPFKKYFLGGNTDISELPISVCNIFVMYMGPKMGLCSTGPDKVVMRVG